MSKPIIVLKIKPTKFGAVSEMAETVYLKMTGNANFVNPQPSLVVVKAASDDLIDAITKWGTVGHRGSHADHVNVQAKALLVHQLLTQLCKWCMTAVDPSLPELEQEAILASSGFPLKSKPTPQGILEKVQNFRRETPRNRELTEVVLRWAKPLNVAVASNVKNYVVYRNTTHDFTNASIIATVPNTTYIDEPGTGTWYYWVAAANNKGAGVTSELLVVKVA